MDLVELLTECPPLLPSSSSSSSSSPPTLLLPPQLGLILTDSTEVLTLTPPLLKLPNKYVARWLTTGPHSSLLHVSSYCCLTSARVCLSFLSVCVSPAPPFFLWVFFFFFLSCVNSHMWHPLHLALTPGILTRCWITPDVSVCIQCTHHSCLVERLLFTRFNYTLGVGSSFINWEPTPNWINTGAHAVFLFFLQLQPALISSDFPSALPNCRFFRYMIEVFTFTSTEHF